MVRKHMILVNGEKFPWYEGITVRDVIREKNYIFPLLVVRINGELVRRSEYDSATIPDNASLDIIHLISGG